MAKPEKLSRMNQQSKRDGGYAVNRTCDNEHQPHRRRVHEGISEGSITSPVVRE